MNADFPNQIRLCTLNFFMPFVDGEWPRGSGFVMMIRGNPTLITAAHVVYKRPGPWFVQLNPVPRRMGIQYREPLVQMQLGEFYYLEKVDPKPQERGYADFALSSIDINKALAIANESGLPSGTPLFLVSRIGFAKPTTDSRYYFLARLCSEIVDGAVVWEEVGQSNMTFEGVNREGMHEFKVREPFRADGYKGASGSPIFNAQGQIVSLLSGGDPESEILYGTPAQDFLQVMGYHE